MLILKNLTSDKESREFVAITSFRYYELELAKMHGYNSNGTFYTMEVESNYNNKIYEVVPAVSDWGGCLKPSEQTTFGKFEDVTSVFDRSKNFAIHLKIKDYFKEYYEEHYFHYVKSDCDNYHLHSTVTTYKLGDIKPNIIDFNTYDYDNISFNSFVDFIETLEKTGCKIDTSNIEAW